MSETTSTGQSGSHRTHVRPRAVWGGLALALVGVALAGAGLILGSWPVAGGGALVLVMGAGVSLAGGIMRDATTRLTPARAVRAVRQGEVHDGVEPGRQASTAAAREEAVRLSDMTHRLHAAARKPADLAWAPVAGGMLLLGAAVLLVSQWELVAHTATGRSNSFRDTAAVILLGLAGLRLALIPGRHVIASGVAGLVGAGLVVTGILATHDHVALAAVETTTGAVAIISAVTAAVSASGSRRPFDHTRTSACQDVADGRGASPKAATRRGLAARDRRRSVRP